MSEPISEIKKLLEQKKVQIGTQVAIKNLSKGLVKKIFLAQNCPTNVVDDLTHMSKISKVDIVKLKVPNDELGVVCKKRFSISVLSVNNE
tara:strand:- start:3705 stop:3974 length:270 start_codon:yes stop_codon:yes gene_type:complete